MSEAEVYRDSINVFPYVSLVEYDPNGTPSFAELKELYK